MALSDNQRLFDISTRLAVYVESVKLSFVQDYNVVMAKVARELRYTLSHSSYDTLDGLSKAKLDVLIRQLKDVERRFYSEWTTKIIGQLLDFTHVALNVNRVVYATAAFELEDDDEEDDPLSDEDAIEAIEAKEDDDEIVPIFGLSSVTTEPLKLWSAVKSTPMGATGTQIVPYLGTIAAGAVIGLDALIRRAWVNKWTISQTIAAIMGENGATPDGGTSLLRRQQAGAHTTLRTVVAHVAGVVSLAVQSTLFRRYMWHSIMDGRTTEICISRNRKIYFYGRGPIPPAHNGCRSSTAPYVGNEGFPEETFYAWAHRQPSNVQDDMFGEDDAEELRNGARKSSDFYRYEAATPRTIEEFRRMIRSILQR